MQSYALRPIPAGRVASKQPDGEPSLFLLRFYEAAVRDLTQPATTGNTIDQKMAMSMTGFKVQPPQGDDLLNVLILQSRPS